MVKGSEVHKGMKLLPSVWAMKRKQQIATQEIYNLEDNYKRDILNLYLEIILNSCSNQEKIIKNRILLIIDYFEFYNFNLINYKKNLSYHPSIFRKATCKWICCNKDIDGDGCLGGLDPRLNY